MLRGSIVVLAAALVVGALLFENVLRQRDGHLVYGLEVGDIGVDLEANNFNEIFVPFSADPGQFRALSFGDLQAFSIVQAEFTYHTLAAGYLSDLVNERIRLVNLGEPGISFPEYGRNFRFWSELLEHEAALFLVSVADDFLSVRREPETQMNRFADLGYEIQTGERRVGRLPLRNTVRLLDYLDEFRNSLGAKIPEGPGDPRYNRAVLEMGPGQMMGLAKRHRVNYDINRIGELERGYGAAARFLDLLRTRGARNAVVVFAPEQLQVDAGLQDRLTREVGSESGSLSLRWTLPQEVFAELQRRIVPGVIVLDLLPVLRCAHDEGSGLYFRTTGYWSVEAHALVGEALGHALAGIWFGASQPEPAGCAARLERVDREAMPEVATFVEALGY